MRRGLFIVFEGIDRCGKTTQSRLLAERLRGTLHMSVEQMNFPDRSSSIGKLLDGYLKQSAELDDHAVHLLFSANRWERRGAIENLLAAGTSIVCDRYAFSGVAFSSAKGLDMEWCKACDRGLPVPDVVFYMDIPLDRAAARGEFGKERYERSEFLHKVDGRFRDLRSGGEAYWNIVDADRTVEEIHEDLFGRIQRLQQQPSPLATAPTMSGLWQL